MIDHSAREMGAGAAHQSDGGHDTFRGAPSFPLRHRALRLVWAISWTLLASWTPPPLHSWRIFLLRLFGARVEYGTFIYGSVKVWYPPNLTMKRGATLGRGVDCYTMGPISLGERAVVSQGAFLCTGTHDFHRPEFQIYAKPIRIGDNAWVCAEAFVGPGVTVGDGAVLGARGAAFKDLAPWTVYSGNPAQARGNRTRFDLPEAVR